MLRTCMNLEKNRIKHQGFFELSIWQVVGKTVDTVVNHVANVVDNSLVYVFSADPVSYLLFYEIHHL